MEEGGSFLLGEERGTFSSVEEGGSFKLKWKEDPCLRYPYLFGYLKIPPYKNATEDVLCEYYVEEAPILFLLKIEVY